MSESSAIIRIIITEITGVADKLNSIFPCHAVDIKKQYRHMADALRDFGIGLI